jgi:indolepyruvate ferredoxin oxidoreductase
VPIALQTLQKAIELNGVAVEQIHKAFEIGRIAAVYPDAFEPKSAVKGDGETGFEQLLARRSDFLIYYQSVRFARRYRKRIEQFANSAAVAGLPVEQRESLCRSVVVSLFKLMSYKDEYEVARLHSDTAFREQLA